jgi:peroxiredoxin
MALAPPSSGRPLFRAPLGVGDIAPDVKLRALDGTRIDLNDDGIAGNPIVLVFCPRFAGTVAAALAGFRERAAALAGHGARLFAVTLEGAKAAAGHDLPCPLLLDREGEVFRAFSAARDLPTTVVLRPNHHVAAILKTEGDGQAAAALAVVEQVAAARQPVAMGIHPPVLVVPDVLSAEDCRRLVQVYETRGQVFVEPGHGDDHMTTDYKMRIPEYGRLDRIDHWIVEKDTAQFIDGRLAGRLFPEIRRAFQYRVTRRERLRMGCYTGERGGEAHGHRDDGEPISAHRRFAMSINLNTEEFSGGALRFPEFGDQRYRPETGAAIVFSCSLLHEAMHVTEGRRLVLLAFLYGEV